jgi:ribosome-associated translation inhibitor RaiA
MGVTEGPERSFTEWQELERAMQTPVEIEFQGMDATPAARESLASQVEKLEERFGRITKCRIVVKAPGNHHQSGGQYDINIRLALPDGREVNIGRTPKSDERHAELAFAINDAFKRARRQLQNNTRRMEGAVKSHMTD